MITMMIWLMAVMTLMMTSAQVVETSVTVTDNSPFQDYPHPDDHTTRSNDDNDNKSDGDSDNNNNKYYYQHM